MHWRPAATDAHVQQDHHQEQCAEQDHDQVVDLVFHQCQIHRLILFLVSARVRERGAGAKFIAVDQTAWDPEPRNRLEQGPPESKSR